MMITSASLRGRSGGTEAAVLITNVVTESASVTRTETALNRKAIENLRDDCNRWLGNTDMPAGPRKPGELADDIVRMIMTHDISLTPIDHEDYLNPENPGDLADEIMRIVMAGSIFTREERYKMRDQIRLTLAEAGVRLIIAMEDEEGRCTASSWRATSRARQPYGPGGFNRCKHTGAHEKHEDEWGNVWLKDAKNAGVEPENGDSI